MTPLPPPEGTPVTGDGSGGHSQPPRLSFAAVTADTSGVMAPRLVPVPLSKRPISYVDNVLAVIFTPTEVEQLNKQRENTLIMKFSAGMPQAWVICAHIAAEWKLSTPPAVGVIDPRHISIHMGSYEDTTKALALNRYKVKNSLFRLFRWTSDFKIGKDSSMVAVWVKLHDLPLQYYNESSLRRICSALGNVLHICLGTITLTQQRYARVCVELDVAKPMLDSIFVRTSKEHGWFQSIEYEGNNTYCTYCGLLGHVVGLCRKKANVKTKGRVEDPKIIT